MLYFLTIRKEEYVRYCPLSSSYTSYEDQLFFNNITQSSR